MASATVSSSDPDAGRAGTLRRALAAIDCHKKRARESRSTDRPVRLPARSL
jgi:hypothetical protein